jgi:hypothetical protein
MVQMVTFAQNFQIQNKHKKNTNEENRVYFVS